jgi:hypothetical protein
VGLRSIRGGYWADALGLALSSLALLRYELERFSSPWRCVKTRAEVTGDRDGS